MYICICICVCVYTHTHTHTHIYRERDCPGDWDDKESTCNAETWVWSLGWEIPCRREWLPTPVFLPVEFHGQWSMVGYNSPWGEMKHMCMHMLSHTHTHYIYIYMYNIYSLISISYLLELSLFYWEINQNFFGNLLP